MVRGVADVIVIGGGVAGCAAAYALARDGHRVTLIERLAVGNDRGSSHGRSRIIRLAYDGEDYVRLAQACYRLWRELETETGEELLTMVGGLDFGVPEAHMLDGIRTTYEALGVPFETMDRAEIVHRFPQLNPPDGAIGYYQPDYALLAADRCVKALADGARRRGAIIREGETVHKLRVDSGGVVVRTDLASYVASRVILAAGSWMRPFVLNLGLDLPLTVTKELLAYFRPRDPEAWAPGRFPLFIQRFPGTTSLGAGFPLFRHAGVKMILDRTGPVVDPDTPDRTIDPVHQEHLKRYVADLLPTLGDDIVETTACRYTMTPDEHFILDLHPAHPEIVVASPCSGHGFKFAPVIGQIAADLATRGSTVYDIARFRLDRPGLRGRA